MKRNAWTPEYRESLKGNIFGLLKVISADGATTENKNRLHCRCACGTEVYVSIYHLRAKGNKATMSCGCWRGFAISDSSTVHGETSGGWSKEFRAWQNCLDAGHLSRHEFPDFNSFISRFGRAPSPKSNFFLGGWVDRTSVMLLTMAGPVSHVMSYCAYFYGLSGSMALAANAAGLSKSSVFNSKKRHPEAYAMGLAEKARRQQAEKSANLNPVRRAPENKTPDF